MVSGNTQGGIYYLDQANHGSVRIFVQNLVTCSHETELLGGLTVGDTADCGLAGRDGVMPRP